MSRDKVDLENKIRKIIFKHIQEYPGVSFSKLKSFHDLNESTLRYHINYLERGERIRSKLENGKLHYYPQNSMGTIKDPTGVNPKIQELSPHQEQILISIKHHPGINQSELIMKTSLKRHILSYSLKQLIDMGIVRKVNNGRNVCYEYISNDLLNYEILKMLAIKFLNNEIDEQTYLKLRKKLKDE